jgi:hypothetical protein
MQEKVHHANSGWYDGAFAQSSIPGSLVAAISWGTGSGLNICAYFQQAISEVSEYQWVYSVCIAWIDQSICKFLVTRRILTVRYVIYSLLNAIVRKFLIS